MVRNAVGTVRNDGSSPTQVSLALESAAAAVGDAAAAVDDVSRLRDATWCSVLRDLDLDNLPSPPDPSLIGHILHRWGFEKNRLLAKKFLKNVKWFVVFIEK